MRTPEITATRSEHEGFTVYEVQAASRAELMQAVLQITGAAGPVEEFRPHVANPGHAQIEVTDAPAFRTIH